MIVPAAHFHVDSEIATEYVPATGNVNEPPFTSTNVDEFVV